MSSLERLDHVTTESQACGSCACHGVCACTCPCCCGSGGPGTDEPALPILTPFLVIPCAPGDSGGRPLPAAQALYSQAIGWTVANPAAPGGWQDFQLQVSCAVANLGPVASPAAMIEFFIASRPRDPAQGARDAVAGRRTGRRQAAGPGDVHRTAWRGHDRALPAALAPGQLQGCAAGHRGAGQRPVHRPVDRAVRRGQRPTRRAQRRHHAPGCGTPASTSTPLPSHLTRPTRTGCSSPGRGSAPRSQPWSSPPSTLAAARTSPRPTRRGSGRTPPVRPTRDRRTRSGSASTSQGSTRRR